MAVRTTPSPVDRACAAAPEPRPPQPTSPTFRVAPGERAAEAFPVKAKGLARAPLMAATLEVLRNCRRDEPITDKAFEFSMEMLIPLAEIQIKGKN
jgi:hypothetical protein